MSAEFRPAAIPVGKYDRRPTRMHWLVPISEGTGRDDELVAWCAENDYATPGKYTRHYDGHLEAVTCRECNLALRKRVRELAEEWLEGFFFRAGASSESARDVIRALQLR